MTDNAPYIRPAKMEPLEPVQLKINTIAVIGMMLPMLTIVIHSFPPLALGMDIAGAILGHTALYLVRKTGRWGKKYGIMALVISYFFMAFAAFATLLFFVFPPDLQY